MKTPVSFGKLTGLLGMAFILGCSARAQTLFINFDAPASILSSPDNAPYVAPDGNAGLWTTLSPTDPAQTSSIGNVTISYGVKASGTSINFSTLTNSGSLRPLALGTVSNTGIYAGGGAGRGGLISSYNGSSTAALGLQITGLLPGEYLIYLSGYNTNATADRMAATINNFFLSTSIAAGVDAVVFANAQLAPTADFAKAIQNNVTVNTAFWEAGQTYIELPFAISSADEVLTLISTVSGVTNASGIFNSMQIVAIPEPSTWALTGVGLGIIGMLYLKKFRSQANHRQPCHS